MVNKISVVSFTALVVVVGLTLSPVVEVPSEQPQGDSEPISTDAETHSETPTPNLYDDCELNTRSVSESNVEPAYAANYSELPREQQRIYDGEGNNDNWNTDIRYVKKDGNWTKTLLACP